LNSGLNVLALFGIVQKALACIRQPVACLVVGLLEVFDLRTHLILIPVTETSISKLPENLVAKCILCDAPRRVASPTSIVARSGQPVKKDIHR
jgi:hypothetical protein